MIVLTSNGAVELCQQWTYEILLVCHLYVNLVDWSQSTTLTDIVEASFPGYSPLPVSGWSPAGWVAGQAVTRADQVVFTCSAAAAPQAVVGYYMTRGKPARLILGEPRAAGPITISAGEQVVVVLPQLTLIP